MEYKEDLGIITIEKDGKSIDCEVLFTFDSEDTGRIYVGYTDHSVDDNNKLNIFVNSYDPMLGKKLEEITDPREVEMVRDVLAQIKNDNNIRL